MRWLCTAGLVVLGVCQLVFGVAVGLSTGWMSILDPTQVQVASGLRGVVWAMWLSGLSVVIALVDVGAAYAIATRWKPGAVLVVLLSLAYLPGCAPISLLVLGSLVIGWDDIFELPEHPDGAPNGDPE